MLDLHQGFTGDELSAAPPTIASVAMAQLDVAQALAHGRLRRAAALEWGAWRTLGRLATRDVVAGCRRTARAVVDRLRR